MIIFKLHGRNGKKIIRDDENKYNFGEYKKSTHIKRCEAQSGT